MTDEVNKLLPSLEIHPFPQILTSTVNSRIIRIAHVACPTCFAIDDFYNLRRERKFDIFSCMGNQPPTFEIFDVHGNKEERAVACAGVLEKHFHLHCLVCHTTFFLSMPEVKRG